MFETYTEIEALLQEHGIFKGDPLNQPLEIARQTQDTYLDFLNGNHIYRPSTTFINLSGLHKAVRISITYPIQQKTEISIVYIRGGGWWNGSLELSLRLVEEISDASGMPVICVDFGLAPQYQFPTQLNQICSVIDWLSNSGDGFHIDQKHCVLWGDSAGGSLALGVSAQLETDFSHFFLGHVLFYGNFNGPTEVTTAYSKWVWSNYLGPCDLQPAVPLQNPLKGIQRAWLVAGSNDPLLHDSKLLLQALKNQSIACDLAIVKNLPHGFLSYSRLLKPAHVALVQAAQKALEFSQTFEQVGVR